MFFYLAIYKLESGGNCKCKSIIVVFAKYIIVSILINNNKNWG